MNWIFILLISILIIVAICIGIWIAVNKEKKIINKGIEVDSIVSRVEEKWNVDNHRHYYNTYVKYMGNDNAEHEALLSTAGNFPYGRKIKIKYLPPKYDYAVFISQEIEQGVRDEL